MNVKAIIDAIVSEGGFDTDQSDTTRAVILGWVQARYDLALSESKWRRMSLELGPTVAGQAQYPLPAHLVDLETLRVDGSKPWLRITTQDLFGLQAGDGSFLRSAAGAFAPNFEVDGDQVVELWPAPSDAGLSISGLVVCLDTTQLIDNTAGAGSTPNLPADLHRRLLVKGGIAEGLGTTEKRADMASPFEGEFGEALKALKRRASSRVGSGPWRARVAGR